MKPNQIHNRHLILEARYKKKQEELSLISRQLEALRVLCLHPDAKEGQVNGRGSDVRKICPDCGLNVVTSSGD